MLTFNERNIIDEGKDTFAPTTADQNIGGFIDSIHARGAGGLINRVDDILSHGSAQRKADERTEEGMRVGAEDRSDELDLAARKQP
jgi:hypothetical protein